MRVEGRQFFAMARWISGIPRVGAGQPQVSPKPRKPITTMIRTFHLCTVLLATVAPAAAQWQPAGPAAQRAERVRSASERFSQRAGVGGWHIVWSAASGTPRAVYGPGHRVADGGVRDREHATALAKDFLNQEEEMLGRGASQFELTIYGKVRRIHSMVFQQTFAGLPVLDGRADVRLNENGVITLFGSEAFCIDASVSATPAVSREQARAVAATKVRVGVDAPEQRLLFWADRERAGCKPRLAWEIAAVHGEAYVDAVDGTWIEFRERHHHAIGECAGTCAVHAAARAAGSAHPDTEVAMLPVTGTVMGWVRGGYGPNGPVTNVPIGGARVQVQGGGSGFTDGDGNFSIAHTGTAPVNVTVDFGAGEFYGAVNTTQGTPVSVTASVTPGSPATVQVLTQSAGEFDLAQSTAATLTDKVARFVRQPHILGSHPNLTALDAINVQVNDTQQPCNAYFQPGQIVFAASGNSGGQQCPNFAFGTVVEHEWGHGLDDAFGGIGTRELGEGWADVITNFCSGQPLIGEDFNGPGQHVRDANNNAQHPSGQAHQGGLVWMGGSWKLRQRLIQKMGPTAGQRYAESIVLGSLVANAQTIPDAVREVFILDDDDGNLNNGTPNCRELYASYTTDHNIPSPVTTCSANPGLLTMFGSGCAGTGASPATCQGQNEANTSSGLVPPAPAGFLLAYGVRASQAMQVTAVEFYTQSASGGGAVELRRSANGIDPDAVAAATATVVAGATPGWYPAQFSGPVSVAQGETYFLVHDAASFDTPLVNSGSVSLVATRVDPGFGGGWTTLPPQIPDHAAWRISCASGGQNNAVPRLSAPNLPETGQPFVLDISRAAANNAGEILFGQSTSVSGGGVPLPRDLASLGAPGCLQLVSYDSGLPVLTDANGSAQVSLTIPNDRALIGFVMHAQCAIWDAGANAFGVALTSAVTAQVGTP